jgi:hypothetical protein
MSLPKVWRGVATFTLATLAINVGRAADETRAKTDSGKAGSASTRAATGKAGRVLPDPVLLDGSTQQPEKKSEYGMIGDFELPGDENVRNGKVGGPQNPGQQSQGGGNQAMGLPQGGGGGGQPPAGKAGQQQGGQSGGPQNPNAAGEQVAGGGDPNAKAEGVQVAQLGGEPSGDQKQGAGAGEKPPPVAIGDQAMQIKTAGNNKDVVGAQQLPGNTQHHEKGTGSGGKGPTGGQGNNRVEKGRTVPAGL